MSTNPRELIVLPLILLISFALVASVWIGGNGGDVGWITGMVATLAGPAIFVGLLLGGGAAIINAL